ncbi:tryptophan halogenase family protein [Parvularcula oceani]|uniref:tryptophan halogenase family protein n=1 Tax=Parvularcula oceani TaxID=1247963 RepID=UPI0004E1FE48|nr:tryptophan halogenase family protein [Parvularcula oceani]
MNASKIESVVILGGGTAGWMAAAVLAKALGPAVAVTLVESDEIGTVGVGEATIPQIRHLLNFLGLDDRRVLSETDATFKLGIAFEGWRAPGHRYIHAFGEFGLPLGLAPFHHHLRRAQQGGEAGELWDYSLTAQAAYSGRYAQLPRIGDTRIGGIVSAFHLDATRFATLLRRTAEAAGVERIEGRVEAVVKSDETGNVSALTLRDGRRVKGEVFLDCSGFRSRLIGQEMGVPFEDWSAHLPCDRAVAVRSAPGPALRPYTQAMARKAGWQWRIPLQGRVGNGHVYSSAHMSDDEAAAVLTRNLEGEAEGEPRLIPFRTGRRREAWAGNVVALGLAAGFMEPLESTSIHLVQSAVERLVQAFPTGSMEPALCNAYNQRTRTEWERIRDFLVLHYAVNGRAGEPFWDERRSAALPESLERRLSLFRAGGRFFAEESELFTETGWVQVLEGQGVRPEGWAPAANALPEERLRSILANTRNLIGRTAERLPTHEDAVARLTGTDPAALSGDENRA